ncbi:MAG: AAA family ATPase [Lachnospiraceae bacterium]
MRTISIINLKGGVGKTVTSINMAYELMHHCDCRVLLIDCDKQGNTSKFMKCHDYDKKSLSDVLLGTAGIMEVSVRTKFASIDVVPANMSLLKADRQVLLDTTKPQQSRLREALKQVQDQYTYCVIDCAPDINISVINALVASDDVIIPVTIDKFAFDGIREILEQIRDVKKYYNPKLEFIGCLVTQYKKSELCDEGIKLLEDFCGRVFETKINWTQVVSRSTFAGEPVSVHSPRCGAAGGYKNLAAEYERRIGR